MVAVTVTAILAAIAVPTMRDYLRNSRLTTASNDLLHSLAVARAEAIKRQTNTIVCGTALPNAAAPVCDGSPFSAWVVFVDANRNGAYDAGEVVIIRHGPLDPSVTVRQDGTNSIQTFTRSGFALPPTGGVVPTRNVVYSDDRGNVAAIAGRATAPVSTARAVLISATGRAQASKLISDVTTALAAVAAN
jgi:type IV fimbrial biogenesis protein FimT